MDLDYRGLMALDAVIALGSFDKAAQALSLSQPAISHRIRALEEASGTLLVIRSQPTQATAYGQRLIAHFRQVRLLESALSPPDGALAPLPQIAIAVNADSAATWIPEALAPLLRPARALMEIRICDQDQTLNQLREGQVFGCVSSATDHIAGTRMQALGLMRYVCVAAPSYAREHFPKGLTAEAVLRAPALRYNLDDNLHARFLRQLDLPLAFPHHMLASAEGFLHFIESGFAYGMLPLLQAQAALAAGALVELRPSAYLDVPLAWHSWTIQTPVTQTLSQQLIDTAAKRLLKA